ncbi:MAG: YkgJ family cysteine cluster protein [Nitrospinae bacterium]|nr:YkgJ family cysteine cluster protein [Nitrospinota bacterium]
MEKLAGEPGQPEEETARTRWKSMVCMTCGACCFSPVIPISETDFDGFYGRLALPVAKKDFAEKFLQDPGSIGPTHYIETEKTGGRCMFLSRKGYFDCVAWNLRPGVCAEYFCWEMVNFEKWMNGEPQDIFSADASFEDNMALLLKLVSQDSPLSVFPQEMARYIAISSKEKAPSYFESHPKEFGGPAR